MFCWPTFWEMVPVDISECTWVCWQPRFRAAHTLLDQLWPRSRIPSYCTWLSELDLPNIRFGQSTELSLSSVPKKSYSASFIYKHIYQNQWKQFPCGINTKEICYKGCTFANYWRRTKIHPSSVGYLCPHKGYGHSPLGHCPAHHSGFVQRLLSSSYWTSIISILTEKKNIFHHHKSTWLLLMLGLKLHKHQEILEERVKWITLDIFMLLTFLCYVFLFRTIS